MKTAKLAIASWWILSQFGNALAAQQGLRGVNEPIGTLVAGEEALRVQAVHQRRADAATPLGDRLGHTSRIRWLATLGKRHYHLAKRDTNGCQDVWEDSETSVPCDDSDWVASADELDDSREVVVQLDESESGLADESDESYSATDEEVVDEEDTDAGGAQDDLGDDEVEEDYYGGSSDDGRSTENGCASRDDKNAQSENQDQHSSSDGWRTESHDYSPADDNYLSAPDDDDAQENYDYFSAPNDDEQPTANDDEQSTANDDIHSPTDHRTDDDEACNDPDAPKTTSTTSSSSAFSKSTTSTPTTTSGLPAFTQGAGNSSSGTNSTLPGPGKVTLNCTTIISFVNNTTPVSNATLATNGTAMNGTDVNPVGANVTVCVPITNTTTNATIPPVVVPRYPCNSTNRVPSGFDGTAVGFAMTCKARYCDPNDRYVDTIWGGTDGNVTRLEIESALGLLAKIPPVLANGIGNVLANGYLGEASRAAGQMYQVTGDRRALDLALQMAENMHFLQNDPVNGTVMWTGLRDPVWPTGPPTPNNKAKLQYAGSENGYIVANMILPALYILKQPCLWDMTPTRVGGWTGPSKFYGNVTYLDRARGLIAAGRRTYDAYFLPWFFDNTGNVIQPNDARWSQVGDTGSTNGAGMPMAFNRRALLLDGMLKLASAYEHPMLFNPSVTASYDELIRVNLQTFVNDMEQTSTLNGTLPSYDWDYVVGRNNTEEVRGIHGWFDVYWFFMAWQRNAAYYNMTTSLMTSLANTMQYTIYQGNSEFIVYAMAPECAFADAQISSLPLDTFSAYVDGHSTAADPAATVLSGGWAYYAYWLPGWFGTVASANSVNFMKVPMYSIPLIWIKNAIATNNWLTGVETMSDRTIILPLPFPGPTATSTTALPTSTTSTSTSSKTSTSTTSMSTSKTSSSTSTST
ncbi:BZ3500_MvSof-1268-A1-R1_Chr10-1g02625 [Microbotryum saponariae]|uniref:BZ3500_MvSof-1268-A1-R1_Chr10-1g02625 protein n=1 Tax=Microbotryum saponariae TaxID=289078 RepID=A0A2X0N912_9BASI|nr:BZ3500_MvSof-1268-A1-R1_Chr10-1g02625 [Microbotryum saponariae]SDA06114.1 BZ3501_MvSof-1269-A2-R1_Chr10-1g02226 [Microbotryum saponariae]